MITVQKISARLRKAGHRPSKGRASCVRGWRNYSPGYNLEAWRTDEFRIYHHSDASYGNQELLLQRVQEYQAALGTDIPSEIKSPHGYPYVSIPRS